MRKYLLVAALMSSFAHAQTTVSWSHPTTYEDGTPLPVSEILGTVVYYGTTAGGPYSSSLTIPAPATSTSISNLSKGTWYFVATSIATNNLESARSNEVSKVILSNSKPKPPKMN